MKKNVFLMVLFFSISLFANETMYTSTVKNLYVNSKGDSVKGRLLPTSKVNVLEKSNGKIKVQIKGYVKEGVPNAIYFVKEKRILVAGLSKSAKFDIKKISTEKALDGVKWSKVVLTAYTKDNNLTKDLDSLYSKAQELFKNNCAICHPAHPVREFTANQWPSMFKAMVDRTAIPKMDRYLVTQYLQKHAKDMKGE
ncbi:cytochrome C [Arcobacter sp. CECT 8985]|uniref:cytochrome C n=1 Tax=Arcobacter sp. CECT 8985 TaxID=1935424 RepID=UPI00100A2F11|nr:cytochrome C [Arcobacter sp. CECT 8985]RXJ87102.1 cytochrome C [Arcobacter sp. CECT 8985]